MRTSRGVSEVVAIILLVAITVVLTGVLYIIVIGLSSNIKEVPPRVLLATTDTAGGVWTFAVTTSDVKSMADYQMRLWINGTNDVASTINPLVSGSRGNLTYIDTDGGSTVTTGDQVSVRTVTGRSYEVFLLWRGQVVDHTTWQT
ncbi:MAG: type IV pilin [Methanobacteriota archaeon]|nr:MAG: type IV pilin [Euryarchaeota archaeon]